MGRNRVHERKAKDFIKARLKQKARDKRRGGKDMPKVGQERKEALEGILEANLSTFIKKGVL